MENEIKMICINNKGAEEHLIVGRLYYFEKITGSDGDSCFITKINGGNIWSSVDIPTEYFLPVDQFRDEKITNILH
jgi:hypothetical protein